MKFEKIKTTTGGFICSINDDNGNIISSLALYKGSKDIKTICFPSKQINDFFHLCNFGTVKSYRRKGYARKLIRYLKENFSNCILYLGVQSENMEEITNKQLVEFYSSEGFQTFDITNGSGYSMHTYMYIEL